MATLVLAIIIILFLMPSFTWSLVLVVLACWWLLQQGLTEVPLWLSEAGAITSLVVSFTT
jgi:hypothetical protein|tara:strand:- start:80 stop:259 length:180 start_codon:yes stop_codon:yes gene_type:complete